MKIVSKDRIVIRHKVATRVLTGLFPEKALTQHRKALLSLPKAVIANHVDGQASKTVNVMNVIWALATEKHQTSMVASRQAHKVLSLKTQ